MSRRLAALGKQVAKSAWGKLREVQKLAKSETSGLLDTIYEKFKIRIDDRTSGTLRIGAVLDSIYGVLNGLSGTGPIVADAIESYSLMQIVLYPGDKIDSGCYEGAMADYEVDEATLYIAAKRALDDTNEPLELGTGEHNVCKDFRSVVAHEIGHLVMPFAEESMGEKFRIVYDSQPKEYWENNVSKYAGTDDHELFGEAFSAWTHPDYGSGNRLPSVLEDWFVSLDITSGEFEKLEKAKKTNSGKKQTVVSVVAQDGTIVSARSINSILDAVDDADWFMLEGDISPALLQAFKDAGYQELTTSGNAADTGMFDVLSDGAVKYAEEHSAELVTGLKETTREKLRGTIEDAVKEGWTSGELADEIGNNFAFGEVRADLIARNELAQAYSYGRINVAEQAGATGKVWLLSSDHDDNEDCDCSAAAEAGEVPFDEDFTDDPDYDFPPGHVNCVFAGNTFVPYGAAQQLVRAWYSGPSIEIYSSDKLRSNKLTVGPNHPILTRRGFVKAAFLRKGDEILYDLRSEYDTSSKSNFQKIPTIENAFSSFKFHRFSDGNVTAAANYFHGDQKFIDDEIDVVRPTRYLLPVFNLGSFEMFGKCPLVGTNMTSEHVSGCSACASILKTIFSASNGGMRGTREVLTIFDSGSFEPSYLASGHGSFSRMSSHSNFTSLLFSGFLIPLFSAVRHILSGGISLFYRSPARIQNFTSLRIDDINVGTYEGYCYDASTEHGIYAANGILTQNCQCDWAGVYGDAEDDDESDDEESDNEEFDDEEHGKFAKGGPGSGRHKGDGSKRTTTSKKYSDKELGTIARKAGEKLYGTSSSGLLLDTNVERMSYEDYKESMGGEASVDTFDYVIFPSTGSGIDAADEDLSARHMDVDGKIYLAGSNGILVISNPPFKKLAKGGPGSGRHKETADAIKANADKIRAMSEEEHDNTHFHDMPGGYAAHNLYEAQKLLPKPSDKLKTVNDRNSSTLHDEYDAIANVDGEHFGISKYEDPDAGEDNEDENGNVKDYVYAFQRLDEGPRSKMIETNTADKNELFQQMRAYNATRAEAEKFAKAGKDQERDSHGRWTTTGMSDGLQDLFDTEMDYRVNGKAGSKGSYDDKETQRAALHSVIDAANSGKDERYKQRHANEARRILRQQYGEKEGYGKFAKQDIDNVPTLDEPLTDEEAAANDKILQMADKIPNLLDETDQLGMRVTGRALNYSRAAAVETSPKEKAGAHQRAYDFHCTAAKHYECDAPNPKAAAAHQMVAEAHKELYDQLVSKLEKYNPDQPRDSHGRFGSGDNTKDLEAPIAGDTSHHAAYLQADNHHEAVKAVVEKVAKELKFPIDKIDYHTKDKTFTLNGRTCYYAGSYNLNTGRIGIWPGRINSVRDAEEVMAHEVGHAVFEPVYQKYNSEQANLIVHRVMSEGEEGRPRSALLANGAVRPGHGLEEKFPTYSRLQPVLKDTKKLIRDDGFTDYSRSYWKAYANHEVSLKSAMHETYAELNVLKYMGKASGKNLGAQGVKTSWRTLYSKFQTDNKKSRK